MWHLEARYFFTVLWLETNLLKIIKTDFEHIVFSLGHFRQDNILNIQTQME